MSPSDFPYKGLFFTGLRHHYGKLAPLVHAVRDRGGTMEFLVAQNGNGDLAGDFEVPLLDNGESYTVLTQYFSEKVFDDIDGMMGPCLGELNTVLVSGYSAMLSAIPDRYVRSSVVEGLECLALFREALSTEKPDFCLVLHEANFWTKLLAQACVDQGVPLISFQEGAVWDDSAMHQNNVLAQLSSKVCLWGPRGVRILTGFGCDPDILAVTGSCHLDETAGPGAADQAAARKSLDIPLDSKVLMFAVPSLFDYPVPPDFLRELVFLVAQRKDTYLVVKLRPIDSEGLVSALLSELKAAVERSGCADRVKVLRQEDALQCLIASDAVCTVSSTIGAEALAYGRPLFEIQWAGHVPRVSYVTEGGALPLRSHQDAELLFDVLENGVPEDVQKRFDEYVYDNFYRVDGKATDRILEVIASEVIKSRL